MEVVSTRSESGEESHEGQELYMAADHKLSVLRYSFSLIMISSPLLLAVLLFELLNL